MAGPVVNEGETPAVRRPQLALLTIPFLWQVGGVPFANEVDWRPFDLPFAMVWQMAGILVATAAIAAVRAIDRRAEQAGPQ